MNPSRGRRAPTAPRMRRAATALLVLATALCAWTDAWAATALVTACGRDDAPGGLNLRDALATGGAIAFRCGDAPATIRITGIHVLARDVALDGEGRVTLVGSGMAPMFRAPGRQLALSGLTMRNQRPAAGLATRTPTIVDGARAITLHEVRTLDTIDAYRADAFTATGGAFEDNGVPANGGPGDGGYGALIDADRIELRRTVFRRNHQVLTGGGPNHALPRHLLSRYVRVDDSLFEDNRHGLQVLDGGLLEVRRSRFLRNGIAIADAGDAWTCCGGAITLSHAVADISDSSFSGNRSAGSGGAIHAVGSRVRIARSLFEGNTARIGGALMAWGRPLGAGTWNAGAPHPGGLGLSLDRVRFRGNHAQQAGGAIAWAGRLDGEAALFVDNHAPRGGAIAHWRAVDGLPAAHAGVLAALASMTSASDESGSLSRAIFLRNAATRQGAAVDAGTATLLLANTLLGGNRVAPAPGAALHGDGRITLLSTTVAGNQATGIAIGGGGRLALTNTLVSANAGGNCAGAAARMRIDGSNLQFPGHTCGTAAASADPMLGGDYRPAPGSPADGAAHAPGCVPAPVAGRDLHGAPRGGAHACAIGAIEPQRPRDRLGDHIDRLTGGDASAHADGAPWRCLFWLLLLVLLLGLLYGLARARRRRRRRAGG